MVVSESGKQLAKKSEANETVKIIPYLVTGLTYVTLFLIKCILKEQRAV